MTSRQPQTPAPGPSTRSWTLCTTDREVDVEVTAGDQDRLGSLRPALAACLGLPDVHLWHGSTALGDELPLTAPELAHGSLLGVGHPGPRRGPGTGSSALELQVIGGPDAGRRLPLAHGEHVVGRGTHADIALDDVDVSRRHLLVRVGGGGITVADLGSTNGSALDGTALTSEPRDWPVGPVIRLGSSQLALTGPTGYRAPTEPAPGGRLTVRPTPQLPPPRAAVEVRFPRAPEERARRGLAWVAVALPAVGGVLMAVLLHTPNFLFFALLAPAMALGTWASDRWSGRRTGRRERTAHAAATRAAEEQLAESVRADLHAARSATPNLAVLTGAAARRSHLLWGRRGHDPDALTVRIGVAPGATQVTRIGPDGSGSPAAHPDLPLVVDLRACRGLGVVGPRNPALGVLAGIIAQLAVLHAPGEVDFLLLVSADNLADWRWARWLPHLPAEAVHTCPAAEQGRQDDLHAALETAIGRRRSAPRHGDAASPAGFPSWLLVLVDQPLAPRSARLLREAAEVGVITLTLAEGRHALPLTPGALLTLTGETGDRATLSRPATAPVTCVVDRLARPLAAALSRDLAALHPAVSATDLPRRIGLLELPHAGLRWDGGDVAGAWPRHRSRLAAPVGRGASGVVEIDLCRLGPHALVAGTTGSGKSEFLQSLIAGLALAHPPDRCSFLLVDYKGGAAFAEAGALPHTVGVLTDLDGRTTQRALRSLTAELLRRESLLAEHQVADVTALPDDVDLARLVIVVDEFATLAEELPGFVPGLIGIAQRGRSLGVHLILATQRPAGVVSPEIRANCTLRICLRTTDETDSRDVLGLPDAAHLPLDRPGRALLRAGAGTPTVFQVARVAATDAGSGDDGPRVRPWAWPLTLAEASDRGTAAGTSDLARLCAAIGRHATRSGAGLPHRPWRPPLPDRVSAGDLGSFAVMIGTGESPPGRPGNLRIGLVDRPDAQSWEYLELDLTVGGGWLATGAGRSGRTTLLRTVLAEAVHALPPQRLHVHVLDHGGGELAGAAAHLPHTGTTVGGDDPLRTLRLLARVTEEVTGRRAGLRAGSVPTVLLLVDGVESLMEQLDEYDPNGGSGAFLRLVRDGAAAGMTCLLTAERAVPGGRLASAVRLRLVLPLSDTADYVVAGVPASSVPAARPPGRALLGERALECQVALPRAFPPPRSGELPSTAIRIPALPERPVLPVPRPQDGGRAEAPEPLLLPIGPGGDDGGILHVDLARSGGLLVTGPPGSGRSMALSAFAEHLAGAGIPLARLSPRSPSMAGPGSWLDPEDDVALAAWLAGLDGGPGAVLVDDLDLLADGSVLARLPAPGHATSVVLLAAAGAAGLARHFHGPVATLRRQRNALLLSPAPGDADLLGIRLPRAPVPRRPGSGWLVTPSAAERVQVAQRRAAGAENLQTVLT